VRRKSAWLVEVEEGEQAYLAKKREGDSAKPLINPREHHRAATVLAAPNTAKNVRVAFCTTLLVLLSNLLDTLRPLDLAPVERFVLQLDHPDDVLEQLDRELVEVPSRLRRSGGHDGGECRGVGERRRERGGGKMEGKTCRAWVRDQWEEEGIGMWGG
jgi:predicted RecB family endonuclease